jgi:amino acid transporter
MAAQEIPVPAGHAGFVRRLSWTDGFALAICIPVAGFSLIGYSIGILGAWTAMVLWAISCVIGLLQNFIFAELAAMFPDKPGGIALYAYEGWRKYFTPVGPLAAVGYWAGWSFALSVYGLIIGDLLQAQFFPHVTWSVFDGTVHLTLANFLAAGSVIAVWLLNVFGVRPAVRSNKIISVLALALITILIVGPFVTGNWHASGLGWGAGKPGSPWGGWKLALVYLYVMGWTAYGTEIAATFSPEYKDQRRDTKRALLSSAVLSIAFLVLGPLATAGEVGQQKITADPVGFFVPAFQHVVGLVASSLVILVLVAIMFLNNTSSTADAGRALYGIAHDGMIVKQLDHLNHHRVPGRAMTVDLLVNLLLVFFVGNILGVLFASNLGYMLAVFFALTGFLLLRKDRPHWPRPIRLSRAWIPIAAALAAVNIVLIVVGGLNPEIAGYGGTTDQVIGVLILAASIVMFIIRRRLQDRVPLRLREQTPRSPAGHTVTAESGTSA